MEIRPLGLDELARAVEIDVTEDGDVVLEQRGTDLAARDEIWSRPSRTAERWQAFIDRWLGFVPDDGAALGAFEDGRLLGIATLRRAIRPGTDQLEALFVDRAHRRRGVATALVGAVAARSRDGGAGALYVSATPSESAVGCYRRLGFALTAEPIPELLELEPEDVHMVLTF
jgi:GNAT superfamily N-acetyltransferase